jgi:hypothetical protein
MAAGRSSQGKPWIERGVKSEDVHDHGIDRTVGTRAGRCWSAADRNFGPCGEENNLRFKMEQ